MYYINIILRILYQNIKSITETVRKDSSISFVHSYRMDDNRLTKHRSSTICVETSSWIREGKKNF